MNNIPTSAVLDAAADAIQMAGWAKGPEAWADVQGGGLCLEGGIAAAAGINPWAEGISPLRSDFERCPAYLAVAEYLGVDPYKITGVWDWNDEKGRTEQEVIEVLRAAAAVERVKEATPPAYDTEDQPLPLEVAA